MKATEYAKSQVEGALDFLNTCVQGMDEAQYNWKPSGTCNPVCKLHAHALASVDFFITSLLQGQKTSWPQIASKAGFPTNIMEIWQSDATISPSAMQDYANSLRESVISYINTLSDEDLDREIDTRFFDTQTVGWVLQHAGVHTAGHTGEISAVKGMQGLKGLPF